MTETFTPGTPMWCAGCGDFAVRSSLWGVSVLGILMIVAAILMG